VRFVTQKASVIHCGKVVHMYIHIYIQVCAVRNTENGERLAVKKVKNAFEDVGDAKRVLFV